MGRTISLIIIRTLIMASGERWEVRSAKKGQQSEVPIFLRKPLPLVPFLSPLEYLG